MRSHSFILLLGIFLSFFSCSKQQEADKLNGKWLLENTDPQDTVSKFLFFSETENGTTFSQEGWYDEKVNGSWERSNDSLLLTYVVPSTHQVDSMEVINSANGNSQIQFYENGELISTAQDDEHQAAASTKLARIESLTDERLSFSFEGEYYAYQKIEKESGGFSFISVIRGIVGIMSLILLTYLFSGNRKKIDWGLVVKGTAMQIIIAILVLKVPFVEGAFQWASNLFVELISYTDKGVDFLFGQMDIGVVQAPLITFAIKVLPTIIFFSALMSIFYYLGVVQKIVYVFAWIMKKFMRLSGAESLAAAGNVFLGQTEAPLLVKPYLLGMTKSELMCLMTGGMATIAGGVLAAYVFFLGGDDPVEQAFFAKHLLTASIISAPAAVVAAKILIPEEEEVNENIKVSKEKIGTNILEAIANGTSDGLRLAVNVGAMLLVFIALMALGNGILSWVGEVTQLNDVIASSTPYKDGLSFQFILGYIGAPIAWLIGVESNDMVLVGELLGQKTILNEFIAYPRLSELKASGELSEKSVIISTYMLCGFANFASIGIQIGGIGSLIPSRKGLLSKLGMRALLGGTVASLLTAAIVGMFY